MARSIPRDTLATMLWLGVMSPAGNAVVLELADRVENERPGPSDLWVSQMRDGEWSPAMRLPASINTDGVENFPIFSSDGSVLLFVRDFTDILYVPVSGD